MKKIYLSILFLSLVSILHAQDEGAIVKKERLALNQGFFVGGGPSFTLSKDIGDYSTGLNFEVGYVKRVNRVLSIGPSISYISFKYDPAVTNEGFNNVFIGGPYSDGDGGEFYQGLYVDFTGGDVSLVSAAFNLKINLIPVTDDSKFSIYAFAKPFVSYASRTEIKGKASLLSNYGDVNNSDDWTVEDQFDWSAHSTYVSENYGIDISDDLKAESKVTGGVFIGPGIEFMPAKKISIFLQAAIGYTFPVSFINTKKYSNDVNLGNDLDVFVDDGIEKYPSDSKGFSSVSVQAGLTFNF
jgi:hypothetical protein